MSLNGQVPARPIQYQGGCDTTAVHSERVHGQLQVAAFNPVVKIDTQGLCAQISRAKP